MKTSNQQVPNHRNSKYAGPDYSIPEHAEIYKQLTSCNDLGSDHFRIFCKMTLSRYKTNTQIQNPYLVNNSFNIKKANWVVSVALMESARMEKTQWTRFGKS